MTERRVDGAVTVAAVLDWDGASPPVVQGDGACLALRAAMARFSAPGEHAVRRADVEAAIAGVGIATVRETTSVATGAHLGASVVDAVALARDVPVVALAAALGLLDLAAVDPSDRAAGASLVADVDRIAAVIGRGAAPTADADAAAERLLGLAAGRPAGAVATVSLLYQCLDATAALLLTTLHARATGAARVAAVPRTRRVAHTSGAPGGLPVEPGDDLVIEIGAAGLEFGAGPHACPGREIAEAIVAVMVDEIDAVGYSVDLASVEVDGDGRPAAMALRRR